MDRGGRVEIVAGIDQGITTKQGLELAMRYSTEAYVFSNPIATFHPKVYLFEIPQRRAVAFVGSSNLTAGGLYTNYEASLGVELDLTLNTDRRTYENILAIVLGALDVTSGNAKRLDAAFLGQLVRAQRVADETRPLRRRLAPRQLPLTEAPPFQRTYVPPAPRIDPRLAGLIPVLQPTGDAEVDLEALMAFRPWRMFLMTLGTRDTRQVTGYSRDVFIPLAARDFDREFWGWPNRFRPGGNRTVGRYHERRIDMLVRPVTGQPQAVEGARLYHYDIKHEFRLNCGRLIEAARAGDVLVIQKLQGGTLFEGHIYEFEAAVIPPEHPGYRALERECRNEVRSSPKRWGYL